MGTRELTGGRERVGRGGEKGWAESGRREEWEEEGERQKDSSVRRESAITKLRWSIYSSPVNVD